MKNPILNMKNSFLLVFIISFLNVAYAQQTAKNSITIQNNQHPEKEQYYKDLIYKADMENYRLKEKDVVLKFTEGFECVLLSAQKISKLGKSVSVESYKTEFTEEFVMPSFSISQNGTIMAAYPKVITK
jgi:hypothetical protein